MCWFCGGCLFVCGGVGVVVVVLVETSLGVGLRRMFARRFINWISALHSLLGGRVERFDRYNNESNTTFYKRRHIYNIYINVHRGCVSGGVRRAGLWRCGIAHRWMSRDVEFKHMLVAGGCGGQSQRS
jgi:hypothetical protein